MRVTPQAAQALKTDIHIVGGTDDGSEGVTLVGCMVHQSHLVYTGQYDESEWHPLIEKVVDIVRSDSPVVSKCFVSVWS